MRKLSLLFIATLILVVMVFAMSYGTALGQGKPACAETQTCGDEKSSVADAKVKHKQ